MNLLDRLFTRVKIITSQEIVLQRRFTEITLSDIKI